MGKLASRIAVVIAIALIATFIIQVVLPVAYASANSNLAGSMKASPFPNVMPKSADLPLLSTLPNGKVDPEVYKLINNGATSIEAIIYVDWSNRNDLLQRLPPGSTLLPHGDEIMKFLPLVMVNLPANKQVIDNLASLPYVKMITINKKFPVRDALQFIDPKQDMENWKAGLYGQYQQSNAYYANLAQVANETGVEALWKMNITGKGVLIGILDTAINPRHPDFFYPNGTSKIVYTYSPFSLEDAYSNYLDMLFYAGHGTHVTSIAAGSGVGSGQGWYYNPSLGAFVRATIAPGLERGMAYDAKIAFFKIFPTYSPEFDLADLVAAIVQAVKVGVDVISASWDFIIYDVYTQMIIYTVVAWVIQNGIVWVNAAGNYGPGYTTLGWPAAQESVITVGATYPANYAVTFNQQKVVYFSSRGPTYPANSFFQNGNDILPTTGPLSAGRTKPDVVAPGVAIMAANAGFEYPVPRSTTTRPADIMFGTKYKALSGTSMSTPVVSGIVALLLQAFPGATPAAIKAALVKGAVPVSTILGVEDPNIGGAGLVNALNAYNILKNSPSTPNKINPPYYAESSKLMPDDYKKIFSGVKILVDDITAASTINRELALRGIAPLYAYDNFINDLRARGAQVDYLSNVFNWYYNTTKVNQVVESPHPYQPLTNEFYHIYYPGATDVTLHFSLISLGALATLEVFSWDYVTYFAVGVGPLTLSNLTISVPGPGAHIRLITGNTIGYGFKVDYYNVTLIKPLPTFFAALKKEITAKYYWLNATNGWTNNIFPMTAPLYVPNYPDTTPLNFKGFFNITYGMLLNITGVRNTISDCYVPYLNKGSFILFDLWLPVASFGFGTGDTLTVNATLIDITTNTIIPNVRLNATVYNALFRSNNSQVPLGTSVDKVAQLSYPALFHGGSAVYGPAKNITGTQGPVWIRLNSTLSPNYRIFVNATNPVVFSFKSNGDRNGGSGIYAPYVGLGSKAFYAPASNPALTDVSYFDLVLFNFGSQTLAKPNAIFFAQYDFVFILTPWYVDNDWINATELKKYVDNYFGHVLFVGGYIPRYSFFIPETIDEASYMLPMGSEVGTGVKMNNYTLPFGIDWVGQTIGGSANIVVSNPVFDPWEDPTGALQNPSIYLGHEIMSMRINATSYKAHTSVWAKDPVYPAIAFYTPAGQNCSSALFISDPFVLSRESYARAAFRFHQWFALRSIALMLNPHAPYPFVQLVNKYFYRIGGVDPADQMLSVQVAVYYNKIVTNGTLWTINFTFMNTLPYSVALNVTLKVESNSTIAGLKPYNGLPLSYVQLVVPAATRAANGTLIPSTATTALGGLVYTKQLATSFVPFNYYPDYNALWGTFKFIVNVYANFTGTGTIDMKTPRYSTVSFVNILNKLPRQGPLPLVSATEPSSLNSYTASLIAKFPLDWKYVNFTIEYPSLNTTWLNATLSGNVTNIAQFFATSESGITFLGTQLNITPESVPFWPFSIYKVLIFPVIVPDGYYASLPHTGHYFAPVFVFIPPNAAGGIYAGNLTVLDSHGKVISVTPITITVNNNPVANVVWDDGLYVENRPAVSDNSFYAGMGVNVFTDHDWPMLPWVNAFEAWRDAANILNVNLKPTGALTTALQVLGQGIIMNNPVYARDAALKAMLNKTFAGMQGYMLIENAHFNATAHLFLISGNPEISLTTTQALQRILGVNKGSLIVLSQFVSANATNPVTGMPNPYNMNWLLSEVGSRLFFPTADNTSAAKGVMPVAHGAVPGAPLVAGWATRMLPAGIPYNTIDLYYANYAPFLDLQAERKLFVNVTSGSVDDVAQFYVENEAVPAVYNPAFGLLIPMPDYGAYQTVPGRWGVALALDTKLNKTSYAGGSVIAFGEYSWFSNYYYQYRFTHLGSIPGRTDAFLSGAVWNFNAEVFLRALFQYVGGFYTKTVMGLSAAKDMLNALQALANTAFNANMSIPSAFYTLVSNAQSALTTASSKAFDGDYIAASQAVANATNLLSVAKDTLLSALVSQVNSAKSTASNLLGNATKLFSTTESYGVDLTSAKALLANATTQFNAANAVFANYSANNPATWNNLVVAYTGFLTAKAIASIALTGTGTAALNLATSLRDQASQVISTVSSELSQLSSAGLGLSSDTQSMITTLVNTYNTGVSELTQFNASNAMTYSHALNAIVNFRNVLGNKTAVLNAILSDAKLAVEANLANLRSAIGQVRAVPHDEKTVAGIDAMVPYLEARIANAKSISELVSINSQISSYITQVQGAVTTPTTTVPVLTIAIIVILVIILIFAIIYAATRRRSRVAVL